MNKKIETIVNRMPLFLLGVLPFLAGCQETGTSLSSLFSASASFASTSGGGGTGGSIVPPGGDIVPTFHNPEPTTMLLVGGGMAVLSYMNKKSKRQIG